MKLFAYLITLVFSILTLSFSIISLVSTNWIQAETIPNLPISKSKYGLFKKCDSAPYSLDDDWKCRKFPDRKKDCTYPWLEKAFGLEGISTSKDDDGLEFGNFGAIKQVGHSLLPSGNDVEGIESLDKRLPKGGKDWGFCDKWITAGYLAILSSIFNAASTLAVISVLAGGRTKRESGWVLVAILGSIGFIFGIASMSTIVDLYRNDWRFSYGNLGSGTSYSILSWISGFLTVMAMIVFTRVDMMKEDHYQSISSRIR